MSVAASVKDTSAWLKAPHTKEPIPQRKCMMCGRSSRELVHRIKVTSTVHNALELLTRHAKVSLVPIPLDLHYTAIEGDSQVEHEPGIAKANIISKQDAFTKHLHYVTELKDVVMQGVRFEHVLFNDCAISCNLLVLDDIDKFPESDSFPEDA